MNYFIDCGAFRGSTIRKARSLFPDYKIIAFEPNPYMKCDYGEDVTVLRKAVWIEDCTLPMYLHKDKPVSSSSTIIKAKDRHPLNKKNPVYIEAIKFSRWLLWEFKAMVNWCPDDIIILKMDIEGAEYEVLNNLIDGHAIDYINELYIEWHWSKMGYPYEKHKKLKEKLKNLVKLHGEFKVDS